MNITAISFVTLEGLSEFLTQCKALFATKTELANYATVSKVQEMIDAITTADEQNY